MLLVMTTVAQHVQFLAPSPIQFQSLVTLFIEVGRSVVTVMDTLERVGRTDITD